MKSSLRTTLVLVTLAVGLAPPATAQEAARHAAESAVVAVVVQLFDGMRAGDSAMVRRTFAPDARLVSTSIRDGQPALQSVEIDRFIEAVGTPREEVWDERLWSSATAASMRFSSSGAATAGGFSRSQILEGAPTPAISTARFFCSTGPAERRRRCSSLLQA
jgi:hypothetical protein